MTWLFWLAAALVVYTYAGYVVWLWMRARLFPWPARRGAHQPSVSIVMVVRNEERFLREKLSNLLQLDYPLDRCEVVVVSDGSNDGTEQILRDYASNARIHVALNQLAQGKASGLNDAMEVAQGEIVLFTDARQMIEPTAVRLLVENFSDPDVGCASGELMLGDIQQGESSQGLSLYWRMEKQIRKLEAASGSVVGATGALYAVRRELLTRVPPRHNFGRRVLTDAGRAAGEASRSG